jgi:elongation factor Ts
MSKITAEMIKELRERTGVGMGKCKEALEEAAGDMEKAIDILRKAGMAAAVKKGGRETNEGLIGIGESKKAISLVEVNSETDFVAQNEKFKGFLHEVAQIAADGALSTLDALIHHKSTSDPTITVDQLRSLLIQTLGENIQIKRLQTLLKTPDLSIGLYSHMGGKIVTAVELTGAAGQEILARDIAMHIAAESPDYVEPSQVPADVKEREIEIAKSQLKGKPEAIMDKIVGGKLEAFYAQVCLLSQKYVKDGSVTISQLLEKESKTLGKKLGIKAFTRWQLGK